MLSNKGESSGNRRLTVVVTPDGRAIDKRSPEKTGDAHLRMQLLVKNGELSRLTTAQKDALIREVEEGAQELRILLGAEPNLFLRGQAVHIYRDGPNVPHYFGFVREVNIDGLVISHLTEDGRFKLRTYPFRFRAWDIDQLLDVQSNNDLVWYYLWHHQNNVSREFLENAIGEDREFALKIIEEYKHRHGLSQIALNALSILGDQDSMLQYLMEGTEWGPREDGIHLLRNLKGEHLMRALVHVGPGVIERAGVLNGLSANQLQRLIQESKESRRFHAAAFFREHLAAHEQGQD